MTDPARAALDPANDTITAQANIAAERAVLGALLDGVRLEHRDQLTAEDFWRPPHATIFTTAQALQDAGEPCDVVTVADRLHQQQRLLSVGGYPYLHTLLSEAARAAALNHYVSLVTKASERRGLREVGLYIEQLGEQASPDDDDLIERARARLDEFVARLSRHDEHRARGAYLGELMAARTLAYEQPAPEGLRTGWRDVDALLGGGVGLQPGTLTVVGARTGVGKSLIGINLGVAAGRAGVRSALFSLEMNSDEIVDRVIAADAGVGLDLLQSHQLTELDWQRVRATRQRLGDAPLYIDDRPGLALAAIRGKSRDLTRERPTLGLVIVDYLQLIRPSETGAPRREQVDAISRGLKLLAKELHVPVVAMAQLNRNLESRTDKAPQLSDLRESGALEQDADIVLLAHRDKDSNPGELQVTVAKNRGGPAGTTVALEWSPRLARLSNIRRGPEAA